MGYEFLAVTNGDCHHSSMEATSMITAVDMAPPGASVFTE